MWIAIIVAVVAAAAAAVITPRALARRRRQLAHRQRLRALQSDADRMSSEVFGAPSVRPTVEVSFSYGWPAFQLTFTSRELVASMKTAGLTDQYLKRIQELCGDSGSNEHPFDASRAVWFTSTEELNDIQSKYGAPRK